MKTITGLMSLFVFSLAAGAQDQQTTNITGRLHAPEPVLTGYMIELDSIHPTGEPAPKADVRSNGEFSLRQVPYGDYLLRVTTFYGETITQQLVTISERSQDLDVALPDRPAVPTGGTVSLSELRHPPARKAIEAAAAAQRFSHSGRTDRAADSLQKAIRISPDYAAAHSNLGVQYILMSRFDDARAEIERALQIAGPNPTDYANLAFAYAGLQRIDDSIAAAHRALALDSASAAAHYLLGSFLALKPATRAEGVAHLEIAARSLKSAQRELERWTHQTVATP